MRGGLVALAVLLAVPAPALAAPRTAPALGGALFKVPSASVPVLESHLAGAPPVVRRLTRLAAPRLTFRVSRDAVDRAHGVPVAGGGVRFVVALRRPTLRPGARGRFTFLHEIGHVVDWAFVGDELRARIREAFAQSPRWSECFALRGGGCVSDQEVFADQFAFWAGARRSLRSGYRVPPLLSRAAFGALMESAGWSDDSPLGVRR